MDQVPPQVRRYGLKPVFVRRFVVAIAFTAIAIFVLTWGAAMFYYRIPRFGVYNSTGGTITLTGEQYSRRWLSYDSWLDRRVVVAAAKNGDAQNSLHPAKQNGLPPSWPAIHEEWGKLPASNEFGYPDVQFVDIAFGFPFRCLALRVRGQPPGTISRPTPVNLLPVQTESGIRLDETVVHGIDLGHELREWFPRHFTNVVGLKVLPSRVLWFGMIANVAIYTALLWGLLTFVAWCFNKKPRVACPSCGYSLAGLDSRSPCPECGVLKARMPPTVDK